MILRLYLKPNSEKYSRMKLLLNKDQKLFFTSDTHYSHANICRGTTEWDSSNTKLRDFDTIEEMNDSLVDNINSVVRDKDVLIHLGDWSFGGLEKVKEFRNRIKCNNIHLVYGNHDHHIRNNKEGIQSLFSSCHDYLDLDVRILSGKNTPVEKNRFICMHYPISSWDRMGKGVIHLHGHCHLLPHQRIAEGRAMDIGMEGNNLQVIDMRDILGMLSERPIKTLHIKNDQHI